MPELRIGSWHNREHDRDHARDTDELRASEASYRERSARQAALAEHLRFHSDGLQRALQKRPPSRRRLAATLREVAKVSSLALDAHHTSIWVFDAQTQTLHCSMLLVGQVEQTERTVVPLGVDCTRCPKYLTALTESRTLAVNDVYSDENTFELSANLRRRNIGAVLDIPVRIPGALLGVICHAHVGGPRTWEREEIEFAAQAGSLLGLALATEQRLQTEHAARSNQYEYRHLVETVPMIAYAFDLRTGKLDCMSPRSFALGGWPAEQWLSGGRDHWLAHVHPSDRATVQARFDPRAPLHVPHQLTYRVNLPDGQVRWVLDTCSRVRKRAGDRITLQGTLRDVTTQMEAELERRELERRHRFMCDHADVHAIMLDQDARVTYVNDYFCRTTGFARQEILGRNWFEFTAPPAARPRMQAEYSAGLTRGWLSPRMEGPLRTATQARRHVLWTTTLLRRTDGAVEGVSGLGVDLTQRLQLEAALQRQTGIDALGRMSAGAVHDLNNLLTVMLQESSRLGSFVEQTPQGQGNRAAPPPDEAEAAQQRACASHRALRAALSQAAELTHSLLEHGRDEAKRSDSVVLDELMQESLHLASLIAGPALTVTGSFHSGRSSVQLDRAQLRQVVLNLVGNAADATRGVGRHIELSTHREYVSMGSKARPELAGALDDDRAVITVTDDGCGIDEETLARIFEPFFTTKGPGQGTGLGLAMCKSIVENAGGHIAVDSTKGKGARFRVYLPLATAQAQSSMSLTSVTNLTPLPDGPEHARRAPCTPARLLVVDDVTGIRCLVADCLREAGHTVFEAADIAAAKQHLATQQLDVLISDASLPDGSGIALARSARGAHPNLKVVMISGRPTALGNFDAVLLKPFDLDELVKLVGSLLDGVAAAAG